MSLTNCTKKSSKLKLNANHIYSKKAVPHSSNSLPISPETSSLIITNSNLDPFESDFLRILSRVHGTIERFFYLKIV